MSVLCFEWQAGGGRMNVSKEQSCTLIKNQTPAICLMDQGGGFMQVEHDMTGTLRKETKGHEPVICSAGWLPQRVRIHGTDGASPTLASEEGRGHGVPTIAVAFTQNQVGDVLTGDVMHNLGTNSNATGRNAANVQTKMQVRRLLPSECEALQGFPRGHTAIPHKGKPAADGPRYKAIGNSMAVPVMAWIGQRIQMVDEIIRTQPA